MLITGVDMSELPAAGLGGGKLTAETGIVCPTLLSCSPPHLLRRPRPTPRSGGAICAPRFGSHASSARPAQPAVFTPPRAESQRQTGVRRVRYLVQNPAWRPDPGRP